MANVIKHKRGTSDPSPSDLVVGEIGIRTDVGKLFTKTDSGSVAEIAGGGSDIIINTLSSSSATGGGSATFNGSAYRFTLSQPPSVSAQQLLVSIAGVVQKPVAGNGQPSEGFSINGNDIILAAAPATGTDFFILTFKSLGVSEPADNSVTSAKIVDGTIVNADINANANITGTKISPNFGSQNIVSTGYVSVKDLYLTDDSPTVYFTDSNNTDYIIEVNSGDWKVRDTTNSVDRLVIRSSGNVGIGTNAPTSSLSIVDSDPELALVYTGTAGGHATKLKFLDFRGFVNAQIANNLANDGVGTGAARLDFSTATGGTLYNRLRITHDGKVGINETNPDAKLQISDGSNPDIGLKYTGTASGHNTRLMFIDKRGVINAQIANSLKDDGVGTAAADLELATSTGGTLTTRMLIDRYGNVGINETSPQQQLHVHEDTIYNGILINGSNAPRVGFARQTTTSGEWSVGIDGTNGNDFTINNSNNNSNRKFIIGGASSSNANKIISLVNHRFNGNVIISNSGSGIDFSATSDASGNTSELLSDYEEGTWTPTASGFTITTTYSARYTKIGRLVYVNCYLQSATGSGTSIQPVVGGLPYTSKGGNTLAYGAGRLGTGNHNNSASDIAYQVENSSTNVKIIVGGGGINEAMMSGGHVIFSLVYEVA